MTISSVSFQRHRRRALSVAVSQRQEMALGSMRSLLWALGEMVRRLCGVLFGFVSYRVLCEKPQVSMLFGNSREMVPHVCET